MPTITWPDFCLNPELIAVSEGRSTRLIGSRGAEAEPARLRLERWGRPVWERTLGPTEPRPFRAWVHDSGLTALIGGWKGQWLSLLDPRTGRQALGSHALDRFTSLGEQQPFASRWGWLRFAAAGFLELPGRGICFSLRSAPGPRLLASVSAGSFTPTLAEQELVAAWEAERALAALGEAGLSWLRDPYQRAAGAQERLGAAALVVVEQGLIDALPALRALEWGGGPCRPGLRRPGHLDPAQAEVHDLRRLAQRALLAFGERPRPLPGARVIRVGPRAALPSTLAERAEGLEGLHAGQGPEQVVSLAGQPDDVGPTHWDYGVYAGVPKTLRLSWAPVRRSVGARLLGVEVRPVLSATSHYEGFERALDPLG